jgi:hypothetical protein
MTYVASHVSAKMRLKTMAKLFVVSIVILTGSPALATEIAHHDADGRPYEQKADASHHRTFETRGPLESSARWNDGHTTHDAWPANMMLD